MKKSYYIIIALPIIILLSSCDLLGTGGDHKDETGPQPELIWQFETLASALGTSPVIKDSVFYIAGRYGVQKALVKNGKGVWFNDTEMVNSFIAGKMKIDAKNLYVHYSDAVKAYNLSDGSVKWSVPFENPMKNIKYDLPASISLISQTETHLFVGLQNKVLIINKNQGSIEEVVTPDIPGISSSYYRLTSPLASLNSDVVFMLTVIKSRQKSVAEGYLTAYNYIKDIFIWQKKLSRPLPQLSATNVVPMRMAKIDNRLAVITGSALITFNAESGEKVWTRAFFEEKVNITADGLLAKNNSYFYLAASPLSHITKLSATDGSKVWQTSTDIIFGYNNRMFFENGKLYLSAHVLAGTALFSFDAATGDMIYGLTAPQNSRLLSGFTSYFDVKDRFLIAVGTYNFYGYKLPKL